MNKIAEYWDSAFSLVLKNSLELHIRPEVGHLNFTKKVHAQVFAITDRDFGVLLFLNVALHHGANQFIQISKSERASPSP